MDKVEENITNMIDETEEYSLIVGGDFNARTAKEGCLIAMDEKEEKRNSKDKKINKEGEKLIKMIGERGWNILNGNIYGDEEGEYTYLGPQGNSVIDYIITNTEALEKVERMKVGNRIDTDHQPVTVYLTGHNLAEEEGETTKLTEDWSEVQKEQFERDTQQVQLVNTGPLNVEYRLNDLLTKLKTIIPRRKIKAYRKPGRNKWWDRDCRIKKRETKKLMKEWKKKKITDKEYKKKIKDYKRLCSTKRKVQEEKEKKEISKKGKIISCNYTEGRKKNPRLQLVSSASKSKF